MTINYAHRGASGYCPENTMAAFIEAVNLGATGIETDVQMTSDGALVLIHDENLNRTTGVNKLVKDVTLDELLSLDAGSWYSEQFAGEKVPTLEQLLALAKEHQLTINLELKNGVIQYEQLEEKVINLVNQYGLKDQVILSSFNHYSLFEAHKIEPDIETGILFMEGLYEPWHYARSIGASALHAYRYCVIPQWVAEANKHGVKYNVWTVNDPLEMNRLIQMGVAGIITDYPDRLHKVLQEIQAT